MAAEKMYYYFAVFGYHFGQNQMLSQMVDVCVCERENNYDKIR